MAEKTTTMRLRSVRFKDGRGAIRVLRRAPPDCGVAERFALAAEKAAQSEIGGAAMTGWAIVAWSHDANFIHYENGLQSRVAAGALPQHVKDLLAAEQAVRWSTDG